ncbi:MAG: TetR family transcriptional regulator [Porticoccaceae bacterium]|nr:TetR family transcriptional regulator [Porticoccaceae bacterium]|tara:strand:- start:536 stop:1165 length:630 start_codon:yes stop_codon:yes gene_type:complete
MASQRTLSPRNQPVQRRAMARRDQILAVTAELLEEVGQDDLTTILVAKRVGISVGTLYHYFPNKYAIMYALAEHWVNEMDVALQALASENIESYTVKAFVERSVEQMLNVYRNQQGLLPLVQAMYGVPELKELDLIHDELIISAMADMFKRMDISSRNHELKRLGRTYLELSHALIMVVVNQNKPDGDKTLGELKYLALSLLERAKSQF